MTAPRVAIVGSGLTGLLAAQGLEKNGIPVVVYEKDPSLDFRQRDWTIMLHWGMSTLGKILPQEVQNIFPQAFCDPFYKEEYPPSLPCLDNMTGKPAFHIPSTWMRLISRQRFRRVLSRGLRIECEKKLQALKYSSDGDGPVTLVFEDGSRHEADIIVGADGPRSAVRTHLLGEGKSAVVKSPWVIAMTIFSYNDAEKAHFVRQLHPVWHMVYGPEGIGALAVTDAGKSNDPREWQFYFVRIWEQDLERSIKGEGALQMFKAKCTRLCEPFRSAAEWIPEGSLCNVDQLKYWVPEPWDNRGGRVTLAGDAAHSIMPFRGQGFNRSMEDTLQLVKTIVKIRDGADRAEAMASYDKDVCERGRDAVLASLEEGKTNMNYGRLGTSKTATKGFAKEVRL